MLDMGPVLPHTPHGDCREVMVFNEGTWDVEIFSLDFDKVSSNMRATFCYTWVFPSLLV